MYNTCGLLIWLSGFDPVDPVDPVPLLLHVAGLGHLPIDLHGEEDGLLCSGGK